MVVIDVGNGKGLYVDGYLKSNLDIVKDAVLKDGWDYVSCIAGIPGAGKSTLAQQICKYLDPNFSIDNICFTMKEFREKTSVGTKGQAFMLDESFADLNAQLTRDPQFIATMNHMQVIRQKGLFLILVLPDFFSLSKNIAIFRSSHLFVVYAETYKRGRFSAFDREAKRELYIMGKPYVNYQCVQPNFRGAFGKEWFVDFQEYEKKKHDHLLSQVTIPKKGGVILTRMYKLIDWIKKQGFETEQISQGTGIPARTINEWASRS